MRRGIWRLLALLLALAMVAAACGDDDDDTTGTQGGGDDGAAQEGPDLSGQSLEVAAIWTDVEQQRFEAVLQAFEERTGAEVQYTPAGDDMDTFLEGRISRGGQPDVAIVAQPALLRQLAEQGNAIALSGDVEAAVDEGFDPGLKEALSYNGSLYGVPFKTANKSLLWYNNTVLEDAGVDPPANWEEFQQAAQQVADSGVTPVSVAGADGWTLTDWLENVLLWSAGPETYDGLVAGEVPWTSDEVKTALTRLSEIWQEDFVVGGLAGASSVGFDESVTQTFTEPAGFLYEGDFVAGIISGEDVATVGEEARFESFPAVGDGEAGNRVVVGGDFPILLRDTEAGQALMEFLATAEAQEVWAAEGGFLSSHRELDASIYPDDVTRSAAEMIQQAEMARFDLSDQVPPEFGATTGQGMWKILQDFLRNPSDVDAIAQALEEADPRG